MIITPFQVMLLLILAVMFLKYVEGFNLSPEEALIFKAPDSSKPTHFGYSVALYNSSVDGWHIVVGAPLADSVFVPNVEQPGAVYICKVSHKHPDCSQILLDPAGNDVNEAEGYTQQRDHSRVGMALTTWKDLLFVCGPRWVNVHYKTTHLRAFMNGICYVKNLAYPNEASKLLPLVDASRQYYEKGPNDTLPGRKYSYLFANGEAGASVHVTKENELLIGAPGVFHWTGTVIRYKNLLVNSDPDVPNPFETSKLTEDSYLGYSLTSGHFPLLAKEGVLYVAGAPRAGRRCGGKVYLLDIVDEKLVIVAELVGKKPGEYFGASIAVGDVNGDGLEDLLIGAPLFADGGSRWDQGRVLVYLSKSLKKGASSSPDTDLRGLSLSGSRFGTSLAFLGDINGDGYNDVAVGAPYEEALVGAVYIYLGGKPGLLKNAAQRIMGSQINPQLRGFGISIISGQDIDGNLYNDVAVGAHRSGHVIFLPACPVVSLSAALQLSPSSISLNATDFNISVCLSFSQPRASLNSVQAKVKLFLDQEYDRAQFKETGSYYDEYKINMLNTEYSYCQHRSASIENVLQDFSKPISIKVEYNLEHTNGLRPLLPPKMKNTLLRLLPYTTGCGMDNICSTDLQIMSASFGDTKRLVLGSQDTISLEVIVRNTGEPAFLAYIELLYPGFIQLKRLPSQCLSLIHSIQCLLGNPLLAESEVTLAIEFEVKGIPSGTESILFHLGTWSSGTEKTPSNNNQTVTLPTDTKADIFLSGWSNKDDLRRHNNSEEEFVLGFELINLGPSQVSEIQFECQIPISVDESVFVSIKSIQAYLDSVPMECVNNSEIAENSYNAMISPNDSQIVTLTCSEEKVKCTPVLCIFSGDIGIQSHASVSFQLIVDLNIIENKLGESDWGELITSAKAYITKPLVSDSETEAQMITKFHKPLQDEHINVALLGGAIVLGLLLLALFVALLYKVGFFRRKRHDEVKKYKAIKTEAPQAEGSR